ncbi:hypothetical protein KI387_042942, partial [Taxus chinensis]
PRVRDIRRLFKSVGRFTFIHSPFAPEMASPRALVLALSCDRQEMAFKNKVSDGRLRNILFISCADDLEAVKLVLGLEFLNTEGWPRINSGITSIFMENLLVLHPSKVEVVKVVAHWICPTLCGNLASEVVNFNLASWPAHEIASGSSIGGASAFSELEHHFKVFLDFVKSLVSYVKEKKAGQARFQLPNIKALGTPLELVPRWQIVMHSFAGDAFDYLWHSWINGNSVDGDSNGEPWLDQDQPSVGLNISVDLAL